MTSIKESVYLITRDLVLKILLAALQRKIKTQQKRSQMVEINQQQFSSSILSQQSPITQETVVTKERPILERLEKIVHKDVIEQEHIQEDHVRDYIEVHEQPIEKRVLHPVQEFKVQEQDVYTTEGGDLAMERERILDSMRQSAAATQVQVESSQDVRLFQQAPTVDVQQEVMRDIVQKPIVTEIHEQKVLEVHDQTLRRVVYERPEMTVVRKNKVIQQIVKDHPCKIASQTGYVNEVHEHPTTVYPPNYDPSNPYKLYKPYTPPPRESFGQKFRNMKNLFKDTNTTHQQ
jgi:hypothetical protein